MKRVLNIIFCLSVLIVYAYSQQNDTIGVYYILNNDSTISITSRPDTTDTIQGNYFLIKHACSDAISFIKDTIINNIKYEVRSIANYGFRYRNIISIEIPASINYIGKCAFYRCDSLIECSIKESSAPIIIDDYAFEQSGLKNIYGNRTISRVGKAAFFRCTSLRYIHKNLIMKDIGREAFYSCGSLETLPLSEGIEKIHDEAFRLCSSIDSVYIPSSVTSIYGNPFTSCYLLRHIEVDTNNTVFDSRYNCNAIISREKNRSPCCLISGCVNTIIPNEVEEIGAKAFFGCRDLEYIEIPYRVRRMGKEAFCYTGLRKITLPNPIIKLGDACYHCHDNYYNTYRRPGVFINRYYDDGSRIFYQSDKLLEIILPDSIDEIGESMFAECGKLRFVYISQNVQEIGYNAFGNCKSLKRLILYGNIKEVEYNAFRGCDSLVIYTSNMKPFDSIIKSSIKQIIIKPEDELKYYQPFDFFIRISMRQWANKTKYETEEMWQKRINDSIQIKEAINTYEAEYITYHTKVTPPKLNIGRYNADLEVFTMYDENYGEIGIKVPYSDWQYVKANYSNATIGATYKIFNDKIVFDVITITLLSGKKYSSK